MCGIVGYVGREPCLQFLYEGLIRLEYRGYDSAGIGIWDGKNLSVKKTQGRVADLKPLLSGWGEKATLGLGHTRWATHGPASQANAHPHLARGLAIVHNGIVENHQELKTLLGPISYQSETDTEVLLHLLLKILETRPRMEEALIHFHNQIRGTLALGILWDQDPERLWALCRGAPLVLGKGKESFMMASDPAALQGHVKKIQCLEDGDYAALSWDLADIRRLDDGLPVERPFFSIGKNASLAKNKSFAHNMLKEIWEQPELAKKILSRFFQQKESLPELSPKRIILLGCGSAYHVGLWAQNLLEENLKIPVAVELGSEFRYKNPFLEDRPLIIVLTQSGETADTLGSLRYAISKNCPVVSICNVPHASIPRESTYKIFMDAGPEYGVASTKAVLAMQLCLYAFMKRLLNLPATKELMELPFLIEKILKNQENILDMAKFLSLGRPCLFLGRGPSHMTALEGALKLKEITYIHAHAHAAGELKHGPLALIEEGLPVIVIGGSGVHREKTLNNMHEVKVRGGVILGLGPQDDQEFRSLCKYFFPIPQISDSYVQAIISTIGTQILSYYTALLQGRDIDHPRNLAKSITVE